MIATRPGTYGYATGPTDPDFASVTLLLPMDGADASTSFPDASSIGHTVTANGNAQVDTDQSKWGGASLLLDGAGDYLSVPDATSLQMGSGDFTIECWYRPTTLTAYDTVFAKGYFSTGTTTLFFDSTNVTWDIATSRNAGAHGMSAGIWYHVACVRSGTAARVYINGAQKVAFTNSANLSSTADFLIGNSPAGAAIGHIDDFRITKGVARYTSAFTPPDAPFPTS